MIEQTINIERIEDVIDIFGSFDELSLIHI